MIDFVTHGMDIIFDSPVSPFITTKVWDVLYGGIKINCGSSEFAAKIICNVMREEAKDSVEQVSKTELRLSMLKQVWIIKYLNNA